MIAIIGGGNVATHLAKALKEKTEVVMVNPHTFEGMPSSPEVVIICVKDDAITEVASRLEVKDAVVAHTSGSVPISALPEKFKKRGVFYPLQTFTKGVELDYSRVPVFIEGSDKKVVANLKDIASLFSINVKEADSDKRKELHLASVFACNFTNAMAMIAKDRMDFAGLEFRDLLPLMHQTIDKLEEIDPVNAQTGPAVRKDTTVLRRHLDMLSNDPKLRDIYTEISSYINKRINSAKKPLI